MPKAKKRTKSAKSKKTTSWKLNWNLNTKEWDWFWIGGLFFAFWALANTYFAVSRHGFVQGNFWSFGNLALFATAWGLFMRRREWLVAVLAISCYTTTFWVVDHLARLFMGHNLLGITAYLYTPGMPVDEFLLAHYHYFTVPVCFLALYFMGKKKTNATRIAAICTPIALIVSYFAFPATNNINCVHTSCLAPFEGMTGVTYSVVFAICVIAAHLGATHWFENVFSDMKRNAKRNRTFVQAFGAVACLALVVSAWDYRYKKSLPHLACAPETENGMVKIACAYTREFVPGSLVFGYKMKNKTNSNLICQARAKTQYNEFILGDRITLAPGERRSIGQVLPNPDVSVNVELSAVCEASGERSIASEALSDNRPVSRFDAR